MYKIEQVAPEKLTALQSNDRKGVKKYPFAEMRVGDSFLVEQGLPAGRVKSAARAYAARTDTRFAVTREGVTFRVVRIA